MNYCKSPKKENHIQFYKSASQLPPEWNNSLPCEHFLQTKQLLITEDSSFPDVQFLYVFVYRNSKPVALAYFQLLEIKPYHVDIEKLSTVQRYGWHAFTKVSKPKLLVAGHLFRHDVASFFSEENLSSFESYQCYEAAINAALKQSCAHAVLVKDVPKNLVTYFQHYAPQYILLRNDISMQMEIREDWSELKDYEKSLKHKYAQRFRKVRQHWDKLRIEELDAQQVKNKKDIIHNLYLQVSKRQQVRLGYLSRDYISKLKENYPTDFHVWLAYEDESPVAFFSAWTKGNAFDMFYIGFDYSRNESLQLYFNILFFSVEQAIQFKKEKLILGRTALEAKARIGCKPIYLSTFLYIKNSLVRSIMLRAQQNISNNEGEWENRHPFK